MCSVCVMNQPGKECKERMCKACCVKHALATATTCEAHGKAIRKALAAGGLAPDGDAGADDTDGGAAAESESLGLTASHDTVEAQAVSVQ
jgi:hypothetical protein